MPLMEDVKSDIIRHLKYEVQGLYQLSPAGGTNAMGNAGYRMFGAYGDLLFRMNWLRPVEEAKITGQATGWISFTGVNPNPGDTVTATLTASNLSAPIVVSVTIPTFPVGQSPYTLLQLAQALATALSAVPEFVNNGFFALADYGAGPFSNQLVAIPVCSVIGPSTIATFSLTAVGTGLATPSFSGASRPVAPYMPLRSGGTINTVYGYIPILNYLEGAYAGETITLSMAEGNGTKTRGDVLDKREEQSEKYRGMLANYMGVPINTKAVVGGGEVCF